ncbi:MAG: DUF169 domain-containing protein [Candidatus Geothermarchaeales archaeon]
MNIEEALAFYIRPQTFPLAIKMLESEGEIPPGARRPLKDLKMGLAICQAIGMARRYGWSLALTMEDISCPLGAVVFGFGRTVDYHLEGNLCFGMYTETLEAGARTEGETSRFETGKYEVLLVSPLFKADFEFDLILLYGNSAQIMRLVQAALYREGGRLRGSSAGRADCSEAIIETIKTGDCQYVLPCYGDRVFGMTHDDEMVFTIPRDRVEDVIAGLEGTHKGGVRYPIPHYALYEVKYPKSYEKLRDLIRG